MTMYQRELKEQAALYYSTTVEAMDLPYEAWAVLRDHFMAMTESQHKGGEDRPSPTFASARECAIDEQAQMMDDPWNDN